MKRKECKKKVRGKEGGTLGDNFQLIRHIPFLPKTNRFVLLLSYNVTRLQLLLVCGYAKECIQLNGAALFFAAALQNQLDGCQLAHTLIPLCSKCTSMVASSISIVTLASCSVFSDLLTSWNYQLHSNLLFLMLVI